MNYTQKDPRTYEQVMLQYKKLHSRYYEWYAEVFSGKTVSGLDAWAEAKDNEESMKKLLERIEMENRNKHGK